MFISRHVNFHENVFPYKNATCPVNQTNNMSLGLVVFPTPRENLETSQISHNLDNLSPIYSISANSNTSALTLENPTSPISSSMSPVSIHIIVIIEPHNQASSSSENQNQPIPTTNCHPMVIRTRNFQTYRHI